MKNLLVLMCTSLFMWGCASSPISYAPLNLKTPAPGKAGIYVYRIGDNVGKDVWINGQCASKLGANTHVYVEVDGNQTHTVSSQGEWKTGHLKIRAQPGMNYFVAQVLSRGTFRSTTQLMEYKEGYSAKYLQNSQLVNAKNCDKQRINF